MSVPTPACFHLVPFVSLTTIPVPTGRQNPVNSKGAACYTLGRRSTILPSSVEFNSNPHASHLAQWASFSPPSQFPLLELSTMLCSYLACICAVSLDSGCVGTPSFASSFRYHAYPTARRTYCAVHLQYTTSFVTFFLPPLLAISLTSFFFISRQNAVS
ncbi:uncharacterized protein EDB91DRAFT_1146803 [Suillus paluster]|uniref:uncharacterized protein n=1 Tax=Suillus paluster TaxID=48578 RepID=UPI001B8864DB|nr:uncharacterized protein EDB91DRAFT_1146803 [Suillus paluster]KAG1734400.1 hypothetical protein EDB91DRAFT_1146803 [Suillus paluster]